MSVQLLFLVDSEILPVTSSTLEQFHTHYIIWFTITRTELSNIC